MNRLEEDYSNDVKFVYLDAENNGEEAFSLAQFRGHPALLLMSSNGSELWRYQGVASLSDIEAEIMKTIK